MVVTEKENLGQKQVPSLNKSFHFDSHLTIQLTIHFDKTERDGKGGIKVHPLLHPEGIGLYLKQLANQLWILEAGHPLCLHPDWKGRFHRSETRESSQSRCKMGYRANLSMLQIGR